MVSRLLAAARRAKAGMAGKRTDAKELVRCPRSECRFGSKAVIRLRSAQCPLCANSGHSRRLLFCGCLSLRVSRSTSRWFRALVLLGLLFFPVASLLFAHFLLPFCY